MDNTLIDWRGFDSNWPSIERERIRKMFDYLTERDSRPHTDLETFARAYRDRTMAAWRRGRTSLRAPQMVALMVETLQSYGVKLDNGLTINEVLIDAYGYGSMPGVTVFPEVPDALTALIERDVQIGIVTNASQPMWLRDIELNEFDLMRFFPQTERRITAADVGYLKPHPHIFEFAVEKLGTPLDETIYVGDNPTADIDGAQGAGMRAVLRRVGELPVTVGDLVIPNAIIDGLDELLAFVDDPSTLS